MSASAPDYLFSRPARRGLWICVGLVFWGQFSTLVLLPVRILRDPTDVVGSAWIALVERMVHAPGEIWINPRSGSIATIVAVSLLGAGLGSMAIVSAGEMRGERLAWPCFLLALAISLAATLTISSRVAAELRVAGLGADYEGDPSQFVSLGTRWLENGIGLGLPLLFYLCAIPFLRHQEGKLNRQRPLREAPLPDYLLRRWARQGLLLLACIVFLGQFSVVLYGFTDLDPGLYPDLGSTLILALIGLGFLSLAVSKFVTAALVAFVGGVGLVVLATRRADRLSPCLAALCAFWSLLASVTCSALLAYHAAPPPIVVLASWAGIYLPFLTYLVLLAVFLGFRLRDAKAKTLRPRAP